MRDRSTAPRRQLRTPILAAALVLLVAGVALANWEWVRLREATVVDGYDWATKDGVTSIVTPINVKHPDGGRLNGWHIMVVYWEDVHGTEHKREERICFEDGESNGFVKIDTGDFEDITSVGISVDEDADEDEECP